MLRSSQPPPPDASSYCSQMQCKRYGNYSKFSNYRLGATHELLPRPIQFSKYRGEIRLLMIRGWFSRAIAIRESATSLCP